MQITGELDPRDLDGIYVRVQLPDGKWTNRCLTDMKWEEVVKWIRERNDHDVYQSIAEHLHTSLRKLGDVLDVRGE